MTIRKIENIDKIENLIGALNSGVMFYRDAKQHTHNVSVASLFEELAQSHERSIRRLQPFISMQGNVGEVVENNQGNATPTTADGFALEARALYTDILAMVKVDPDFIYINQLEEVEEKLLKEVRRTLTSKLPLDCLARLTDVQHDVTVCHGRMRSIQWTRQRKAS